VLSLGYAGWSGGVQEISDDGGRMAKEAMTMHSGWNRASVFAG